MPLSLRLRTLDGRPASAVGRLLTVDGDLHELLDELPTDAQTGDRITLRARALDEAGQPIRHHRLTVVAVQR